MKKLILLTCIASYILLFSSCDKVADATNVCAKKWVSVKPLSTSTATAAINAGALVLSAPNLVAGVNLTVNQASVSGDFEAQAEFEDFNPGVLTDTCTAFFQFAAIPMAEAEVANTGIANVSSGLASSIFAGSNATTKGFINQGGNLKGTLKIKRTGSALTITTIVYYKNLIGVIEPITSTATKADYGTSTVNIGFQLGAIQNVNKPIHVNITNFSITGGGVLAKSDSFDCNSVL